MTTIEPAINRLLAAAHNIVIIGKEFNKLGHCLNLNLSAFKLADANLELTKADYDLDLANLKSVESEFVSAKYNYELALVEFDLARANLASLAAI